MASPEDSIWLNIRDCHRKLNRIYKSSLLDLQTTALGRQNAQSTFRDLQKQVNSAEHDYEHKRKKWITKLRNLFFGDELRARVEILLKQIEKFETTLKRGARYWFLFCNLKRMRLLMQTQFIGRDPDTKVEADYTNCWSRRLILILLRKQCYYGHIKWQAIMKCITQQQNSLRLEKKFW